MRSLVVALWLALPFAAHAAAPSCPPAPVGKGTQPVVVGLYVNQIAPRSV